MTGPRPRCLVLVAGTGTEVGKTWVSARLLEAWRGAGLAVAARKPAQSYDEGAGPTDAEVLAAASGEDPVAVCPEARSYPVALAPPMAAEVLGRPVPTVASLVAGIDWPAPAAAMGLVETAGGVRSPQADDGDVTHLSRALAPDRVVLVADAGLGTINAVRMTLAALDEPGATAAPGTSTPAPFVVLNRFDPGSDLHRRNLAWLRDRDGVAAVAASTEGLFLLARKLVTQGPGDTSTTFPSLVPRPKRS